ncbi:uncharacterized protein LOC116936077 isoform X4 [Daphnia magna]|uniref:uncharacterized protein LOC116936077 isoform X4 n=1 Tax=Daphnia magna TaxID=35525 RepID=UPI001E1BB3E5|nr:uncharacterized protein LOC116936077 isoform X4 [Daphnia magna]
MSSNLVKDPHASSSRTERNETPATLQEETPQNNAPNETTSADEGVKEPVYPGSKLFRVNIGSQNAPEYSQLSHEKNKRKIFDGFYNCDVPVAILKILRNNHSGTTQKELERECQILKELEVHENFIRYIAHEWDEDFEYIATERCLFSVADLLDTDHMREVSIKNEILKELGAKEILRQATRGLHYLHQNDFIHRNIKPNNFLIKEINKIGDSPRRFVVKITDFRITRKRNPNPSQQDFLSGSVASQGWEAPESKNEKKELSTKLDVFILGCFYHYVMIALSKNEANKEKPKHPFGNENSRPGNICNDKYFVYKDDESEDQKNHLFVPDDKDEDEKEVAKLIKRMLKYDEDERPTLFEVLESSYFKPSGNYEMYEDNDQTKKPGLCVIFNVQIFQNGQNREGSDMDRDALKDTFNKLGFDTAIYNDIKSFDLKSEIKSLAKLNFKDYGCLVVCLLSHGIENAILCSDRRYVNINELKYEFSLNKCPTLYGKPKIFIVQACQGSLSQSETGIVAPPVNPESNDDQNSSGESVSSPSTVQLRNKDVKHTYSAEQLKEMKILDDARRNPPLMDFITIKATLPGFLCYRNKKKGSRFIRSLCKALSQEYLDKIPDEGTQHLEDLLRCVQVEINAYSEKLEKNSNIQKKNYWQTMTWEVCLSKHIRFRKGVTEGKDVELR